MTMPLIKRLFFLILMLLLLISGTTTLAGVDSPAPEQAVYQEPGTQVRSNGTVRIRNQPRDTGAVLGQIGWGEVATLLAIEGRWYQIDYEGMIGWVASEWFVIHDGSEPAPVPPPANAQPSQPNLNAANPGPGLGVVEARGTVRLRDTPSLTGAELANIAWGEQAILIGQQGVWYQVNYNGVVGWVAAEWFVMVSGEPISNPPAAMPDTAPTIAIPASDTMPITATGEMIQAQGNVVLRESPTTISRRLANIGWGQQVKVLGVEAAGLWYQVEFNGLVGWVAADWFTPAMGTLAVVNSTAPAPNTTVEAENPVEAAVIVPVTASADGSFVQALDSVRIRAEANNTSAVIGQIGWGQVGNLLAVDSSGLWYQISYNGATGWVRREWFLRTGTMPQFVPVPEVPDAPAPTAGTRLRIPKIGVDSPIVYFPIVLDPVEGAIWYIAPNERYVGHLEGTTAPGQVGNVVLGAHSEYPNGSPGLFSRLGSLAVGDQMQLNVGGVIKNYAVTRIFTVPFTDVSVVMPTGKDQITLITCTSYSAAQGLYLERIIVVAEPS